MAVDIRVLGAERVRVDEELAFDLGPVRLREIVRRIRLAPLASGRPRMEVRILAVTDAQGTAWPVRTWQWGDELEIRIGSGESFLTGGQSVHLAYEVAHAIAPGRAREMLTWEVTGGPWDVPILEAQVNVHLPPGADPEAIDAGSEIGRPGESVRAADFRTIDGQQVRFAVRRGLGPREPLRVFASWPAELTPPIGPAERLGRCLTARPWWGLPLVALALVIAKAAGRRQARARARAATAPAPALAPAELGFVSTGKLAAEDLVATALDLARRGRLQILPRPDGTGYRFFGHAAAVASPEASAGHGQIEDAKDDQGRAAEWSSALFPPLARADSAAELALEPRIVRALPAVAAAIARELVRSGYLAPREKWRALKRYGLQLVVALVASCVLAMAAGARFPAAWPGLVTASVLAAALPLAIDGRRRTARGEEAAAWASAFVTRAGADPEGEPEPPSDLDSIFPLAVALGVGASWMIRNAGSAGGARLRRPSYWPSLGASGDRFEPEVLVRELALLSAPFRSAFAASGRFERGGRL
jgi:hypothetical protein